MKLIRKIVVFCLVFTLALSINGISACAAESNEDSAAQNTEEYIMNSGKAKTIAGAGSVSTGVMVIFYPVGQPGYINITAGGVNIVAFPVNGTGSYSGGIGSLTAGTYGLSYIIMSGTIPLIMAQGTLTITT